MPAGAENGPAHDDEQEAPPAAVDVAAATEDPLRGEPAGAAHLQA